MVKSFNHFDLFGKQVIQHSIVEYPLDKKEILDGESCFAYAIRGRRDMYSPIEKVSFNESEGILMKCGNFVSHFPKSHQQETFEAIVFHFYPDVLDHLFQDEGRKSLLHYAETKATKVKNIELVHADRMMKNYIDSVLFYFQNPSLVNQELIEMKLKEILLLLLQSDSEKLLAILSSSFNNDSFSFRRIVEEHIFDDLSLEELAHLCHVSVSTFKRKFRKLFNDSPTNYIKNTRLEYARNRLSDKQVSITEVCFDSGFSDTSYFSKSFKQKYGLSPLTYRNKL